MNTRNLSLFLEVANSKSVSEAARKLFISQPALSMQMKRLEESFGVNLITFLPKGLKLTDAGLVLKEYAERLLSTEEQLMRAMEDFQDGKRGRIIIGSSDDIAIYFLPYQLADFMKQNPDIDIEFKVFKDDQIEQLVKDGIIDLGLTFQLPSDHLDLRITSFIKDTWAFIFNRNNTHIQQWFVTRDVPEWLRRDLPNIVVVDQTEMIKQCVIAGLGHGIVLNGAINGKNEYYQIEYPENGELMMSIITRPSEKITTSLKKFISYLHSKSE
jgi:DNA-binding transcriptional LysR family regulator